MSRTFEIGQESYLKKKFKNPVQARIALNAYNICLEVQKCFALGQFVEALELVVNSINRFEVVIFDPTIALQFYLVISEAPKRVQQFKIDALGESMKARDLEYFTRIRDSFLRLMSDLKFEQELADPANVRKSEDVFIASVMAKEELPEGLESLGLEKYREITSLNVNPDNPALISGYSNDRPGFEVQFAFHNDLKELFKAIIMGDDSKFMHKGREIISQLSDLIKNRRTKENELIDALEYYSDFLTAISELSELAFKEKFLDAVSVLNIANIDNLLQLPPEFQEDCDRIKKLSLAIYRKSTKKSVQEIFASGEAYAVPLLECMLRIDRAIPQSAESANSKFEVEIEKTGGRKHNIGYKKFFEEWKAGGKDIVTPLPLILYDVFWRGGKVRYDEALRILGPEIADKMSLGNSLVKIPDVFAKKEKESEKPKETQTSMIRYSLVVAVTIAMFLWQLRNDTAFVAMTKALLLASVGMVLVQRIGSDEKGGQVKSKSQARGRAREQVLQHNLSKVNQQNEEATECRDRILEETKNEQKQRQKVAQKTADKLLEEQKQQELVILRKSCQERLGTLKEILLLNKKNSFAHVQRQAKRLLQERFFYFYAYLDKAGKLDKNEINKARNIVLVTSEMFSQYSEMIREIETSVLSDQANEVDIKKIETQIKAFETAELPSLEKLEELVRSEKEKHRQFTDRILSGEIPLPTELVDSISDEKKSAYPNYWDKDFEIDLANLREERIQKYSELRKLLVEAEEIRRDPIVVIERRLQNEARGDIRKMRREEQLKIFLNCNPFVRSFCSNIANLTELENDLNAGVIQPEVFANLAPYYIMRAMGAVYEAATAHTTATEEILPLNGKPTVLSQNILPQEVIYHVGLVRNAFMHRADYEPAQIERLKEITRRVVQVFGPLRDNIVQNGRVNFSEADLPDNSITVDKVVDIEMQLPEKNYANLSPQERLKIMHQELQKINHFKDYEEISAKHRDAIIINSACRIGEILRDGEVRRQANLSRELKMLFHQIRDLAGHLFSASDKAVPTFDVRKVREGENIVASQHFSHPYQLEDMEKSLDGTCPEPVHEDALKEVKENIARIFGSPPIAVQSGGASRLEREATGQHRAF